MIHQSKEKLRVCPITLKQANAFVEQYHRHHAPVYRDKFRVGAEKNGELVGVVQIGRPVSRNLDDGKTVEVTRLCSNGERNVCSFLYAKAAKIAKEMGYLKIITYILKSESGISLQAAGWNLENDNCGGGSWDTPSRHRTTTAPTERKQRWAKNLSEGALPPQWGG